MIVTCVPNVICLNFRKFYALLTIQLSISTGFNIINSSNMYYHDVDGIIYPTNSSSDILFHLSMYYENKGYYSIMYALIGSLAGLTLLLCCINRLIRKFPNNIVLIIGYSVLQGCTGGTIQVTVGVANFFSFSLIHIQQMRFQSCAAPSIRLHQTHCHLIRVKKANHPFGKVNLVHASSYKYELNN